jgi:hypothetical protein
MSTTYLNTKSRGLTKTVAEFSKQDGQVTVSSVYLSRNKCWSIERRNERIQIPKTRR